MNIEAFVFLGIVLLVWFFASIGSWLRQQMEQYSQYREESNAREEFPPSPDSGHVQSEEVTAGMQETTMEPSHVVAQKRLTHPASGRLRYRSRKAARQGIILMTVFGPCKALEPRDESC